MSQTKRKISVSLDSDLVAELGANADGLSAQVNSAVRAEVTRQRRQRALGALLDQLAAVGGPLDTPEDEVEIARYMRLLGGVE
jgi:Post-segregation antitoxin CcdA